MFFASITYCNSDTRVYVMPCGDVYHIINLSKVNSMDIQNYKI